MNSFGVPEKRKPPVGLFLGHPIFDSQLSHHVDFDLKGELVRMHSLVEYGRRSPRRCCAERLGWKQPDPILHIADGESAHCNRLDFRRQAMRLLEHILLRSCAGERWDAGG